jgi:hypothetical protein
MKPPVTHRWSDKPGDGSRQLSDDEVLGGTLFRAAQVREPLAPEAMRRIEAKLLADAGARTTRPFPRWKVAMVSLLLLGVGSVSGAGITVLSTGRSRSVEPVAAPEETALSSNVGRSSRRRGADEPVRALLPKPAADSPEEPAAASVPTVPSPSRARRAPPAAPPPEAAAEPVDPVPPSLPPPPPPSATSVEAQLLWAAVRKLRVDGDPAAALVELDEYDRRLAGGGLFAGEVHLARVEALRALGRTGEARALLESLDIDRLPRSRELRVLRGELRASAGRWTEALGDFERVLTVADLSPLTERSLYGRGSCRLRLGDREGADADFAEYLKLFPDGPNAVQVRRALGD